jgi:plastocyanin
VRTKTVLPALCLLAVLGTACSGRGAEPDGGTTPEKPAGSGVEMRLIAFKPEKLEVPGGTTVTWKQADAGFHTVTSGTVAQGSSGVTEMPDGRFDSGQLATDATFTFSFDDPGSYPYFCAVHPATMRGEVTVT